MKKIILLVMFVLMTSAVYAQCKVTINSKTTKAFLNEIPSLNTQLQSCPIKLPGTVSALLGTGTVRVDVGMNDGSTSMFFFTLQGSTVTGITTANSINNYLVQTDEDAVDALLQSNNKIGAFFWLYSQKRIKISAVKFFSKLKLLFTKPVLGLVSNWQKPSSQSGQGKPKNCDDTWLPGHKGYAQNKATWDQYSSQSKGVCQSQYGKGIPSPCKYKVQLSVQGNPYYLCWYD